MTNKEFASIFRKYKDEAHACLYSPSGGYAWQDRNRTVELMNDILAEIPSELYPKNEEDCVTLSAGNWRLGLMFIEGKRSANLIYVKDDHTAWVIENDEMGRFIDFDIGGS